MDLTLSQNLLFWAGLALAWLSGESVKVIIASGLGGFVRHITSYSGKRRFRDGVVSIVGGAVAGTYLWPGVLMVLRLEKTEDHMYMAAFLAGTLGVSLVKIFTAVVESKFRKTLEE